MNRSNFRALRDLIMAKDGAVVFHQHRELLGFERFPTGIANPQAEDGYSPLSWGRRNCLRAEGVKAEVRVSGIGPCVSTQPDDALSPFHMSSSAGDSETLVLSSLGCFGGGKQAPRTARTMVG